MLYQHKLMLYQLKKIYFASTFVSSSTFFITPKSELSSLPSLAVASGHTTLEDHELRGTETRDGGVFGEHPIIYSPLRDTVASLAQWQSV